MELTGRLRQEIQSRRFVRFLAAGGLAALANFGSRFVFSEFLRFEYAVVLAFIVGLGTGFVLSRTFVFARSRHSVHIEATYYLLVNLFALVQTWLLSVYLAVILSPRVGEGWGQAIAHLAGIMLPVVTSYFGHRFLTFRERSPDGE